MTFKDRLRTVRSATQLHAVMEDLLERGSPDWTRASTRHYVPERLWTDLDRYFGPGGRLRRPDDAGVIVGPDEARSDDAGGQQQHTEPIEGADPDVDRPARTSISEVIDRLHETLRNCRERHGDVGPTEELRPDDRGVAAVGAAEPDGPEEPVRPVDPVAPPGIVGVDGPHRPVAEQVSVADTLTPEPANPVEARIGVEEPLRSATEPLVCPICVRPVEHLDGSFRGKPMCRDCARKFVEQFVR